MHFELTEAQRSLREEARKFAREEIEPRARELDRSETYPEEILAKLGERRYAGLTLPEEYGGRGEGLVELALVVEELSAALMSVASSLALHLGVATVVERFGTDEQRDTYLPEMATYDTVGALGLSEANAGSNKLQMETRARRDGSEWVLNGHKQWVTNFLDADVVLTYAKTGPDEDAPHNVSAFLVPAAEFEVETVWETLGAKSVKSPRVTLSDVRVGDDRLVGEAGEAYVQRGTVHTGVNVPARGVGIARAALEDTVEYTRDREQYGGTISDFQGVRWEVAKMAERVDTARLLTLRAADRADRAEAGADVRRETSMAKIRATQAAVDNANDAVQLHGGVGYTTERDVERYLRDARLLTIAGGPNETHKNTLADAVFDS
ncbi:Acyl-CoA dehydrogenase, middle domain [Halopelagius inordinatus]|uniref:Acyl-CoA dehydrogenase, middle domain n=1 Tax=Halopelagius inordinatus TaxID=553467 RepID=A0A1I2N688_9EURY|nr:acyl-CoA dehydrogenase family protein [Halopelagius inordinatus]SFF97026.1 Acyl-CoA dehydrogenase, middle domain [Halopelagius inordinatus]